LKVIARCGCGNCPTILFGKSFDSEIQRGELMIDSVGKSKKEKLIGIMVFGTNEIPKKLEFYSIDGETECIELPKIETLKRAEYN
jgi:hypothetical protein